MGIVKEISFLKDTDITKIERQYPDGLTLAQIIDIFASRGLHISEATFRKYVQLGLLVHSRRIGRKGKHQGSLGMYPTSTIRRVNLIRKMMTENYTIEDIQRSFLRFKNEIESLKHSSSHLLSNFEKEIALCAFSKERKKALTQELAHSQMLLTQLFKSIETLERQLVSPLERAARERSFSSGAARGAEDLLD